MSFLNTNHDDCNKAKRGYDSISKQLLTDRKRWITEPATTTLNGPTVLPAITTVAQGTQNNQRIGRSITIKHTRIDMGWASETTTSKAFVRMMVVIDKQTNGTTLDLTQLFTTLPALDGIGAMLNRNNRHRYDVWHDEIYEFERLIKLPGTAPRANYKHITINIPKTLEMTYTGVGGLISEITSNNMYIVAIPSLVSTTGVVTTGYAIDYTD